MMERLLALRASAGSGKTFNLTLRYLWLLFEGVPPQEILALTFTKKATAEMKGRITQALEEISQGEITTNPFVRALLSEGLDPSIIEERRERVYRRFLEVEPRIMTLDAFFFSIMRKFCWYAGIPHDFAMGEFDSASIMKHFCANLSSGEMPLLFEILDETSGRLSGMEILHFLNDLLRSQDVLSSKEFLALKGGREEQEILALAHQIKNRVLANEESSEAAKNAVDFSTIRELCDKGKTWLTKENLSEYRPFKPLKASLADLESTFCELQNALVEYWRRKDAQLIGHLLDLLETFEGALKAWQHEGRVLTFDQVARETYQLLRQGLDREFLYFRLDSQIAHILVDEFQDTSILQYKILEPLIEEARSGMAQKEYRTFFFVGDTKQSIYRFRGSHAHLFEEVAKGMKVLDLPYNYRSHAEIIEFVNEVFSKVMPKPEYLRQESARDDQGGFKKPGGYVEIKEWQDEVWPALSDTLHRLLERGISADEIAILVSNNQEILAVSAYLEENMPDLRVVTEANAQLTEQRECKILKRALWYLLEEREVDGLSLLALAGCKPDLKQLGFLPPLRSQKTSEALLSVMREFSLFTMASRRFLEHSLAFDDPREFLESLGSFNETIPTEELSGVRILTIHKSKGLEFPHVILLDGLKRGSTRHSPFLFDYQGLQLRSIHHRTQGEAGKLREKLDPLYRTLIDQENSLETKDLHHKFYVAFTRAEASLFLLCPIKSQDHGIKNLFELAEGCRGEFPTKQQETPSAAATIPLAPLTLTNWGRQSDFLTQSESDGGRKIYAKEAVEKGEAFHLFMEHTLRYHADLHHLRSLLKNRFGYFLSSEALSEMQALGTSVSKDPRLAGILQEGRVEYELPFLDGKRVGRMDLLVCKQNGFVVVDYKSGVMPQAKDYEQVRHYEEFLSRVFQRPALGYLLLCKPQVTLQGVHP